MSLQLSVPNDYGYVIVTAAATFVLSMVHGTVTGRFRRAAGVKYPNAYASEATAKESQDAFLFNCAQRAHANFTENHTTAVGALLLGGLHYPRVAALLGSSWVFFRTLYLAGYVRPSWGANGGGRYKGIAFFFSQLGLMGLAALTGVEMIRETW